MSRRYFGTDGVRGRVGEGPITPDFVLRLGFAAGEVLVHAAADGSAGHPGVLIGKDTRISGYMLESALESGLAAAGVDVLLCGPLPTPGVAYLTRALRLQAGVVISASHNRFEDNGIKFFGADGGKLDDRVEMAIEAALERPMRCRSSRDLGKARRIDDAQGRYIEFCKSTFPADLDLRGLKLVVDCAHGAAYQIAPKVFHELGADVVAMGDQPNGFNINDGCGATQPNALRERVVAERAHLGISLDGDGDRLMMCDAGGALYDGDQLLYVIVGDRLRSGRVTGVAGTLMTNLALERALGHLGIPFARAKVGDRYVLEAMLARGWTIGGENSGHIICLDKHTTGDGIISALQVAAAVVRSGRGLAELTDGLRLYPQTLLSVPVERADSWIEDPRVAAACGEAERALGDRGRVLLRASGTEPVLRVMVEGEDGAQVARLAQSLADRIRAVAHAA